MIAAGSGLIFIYSREGSANSLCVERLKACMLERGVAPERITTLPDNSYLRSMILYQRSVLVVPGGNASILIHDLQEQEYITRIKRAVDGGLNYLGFCAGADLACDTLSVQKNDGVFCDFKDELKMSFLSLLNVNAVSPAFPIKVATNQGGNNNRLVVATYQEKEFSALWNEGPKFEVLDRKTVNVDAVYNELPGRPAAAVSGVYGKGIVALSAVHPEICLEDLDVKSTPEQLKNRKEFLTALFKKVGILK
jgi:glutamine amidotransferase-like uncharacterized protein